MVMPHLITSKTERQAHPIYPKKEKCHHNLGPTSKKHNNEKEQTTQIPKTYDAIKSAAGADMKAKGKK
jgi:hypothetical protein